MRVNLVHQNIDVNTIVPHNCYPSNAKNTKRLCIGQFELLLYLIYTGS